MEGGVEEERGGRGKAGLGGVGGRASVLSSGAGVVVLLAAEEAKARRLCSM